MKKYESPIIEIAQLEANDIITASSNKYEIEDEGEGSGNVIFDTSNLFSKLRKQ